MGLQERLSFQEKIGLMQGQGRFVCVGLDPQVKDPLKEDPRHYHIPEWIVDKYPSVEDQIFYFNRKIIQETSETACAYKPNSAFYEAFNHEGETALEKTVCFIRRNYPRMPIILDAKRGDIGNTNLGYVKNAFDELKVDAITVSPWLGQIAMRPFLDRKEKGIFILARTSNEGADEFQSLMTAGGERVYEVVARRVATEWNKNGNCGLVVGATCPEELLHVRRIVGDIQLLIPGVGAQGGDLEATVRCGIDSRGWGMIINSSRGIIFASRGTDFAEAARRETEKLHDGINRFRQLYRTFQREGA